MIIVIFALIRADLNGDYSPAPWYSNMPRPLNRENFESNFQKIIDGPFNEIPEYYTRYKSRYWYLTRLYASLAETSPISMLDIGGGQFAVMAKAIWGDHCTLADLGGKNYEYLHSNGVETVEWNLYSSDQPFTNKFDIIMFSEVIEHIPLPAHLVLQRLRIALRPGGVLICTTPNLHRAGIPCTC